MKTLIYDSFTDIKFAGNQAGIVVADENISSQTMQNIAKEFNFSETVFLFESSKAIRKVRFFTPSEEVDLCGHATIAYVKYLMDEGIISKGIHNFETNLGVMPVVIDEKDIMMYQDDGVIKHVCKEDYKEIMSAMGLDINDLDKFEIVKGYSGLWDLLIHLKSKDKLDNIKVNREKMLEVSKKLDIISFHPFVLDKTNAYVRNFAPIVEIDEESATGTSNGALAFHLYKLGYLKGNEKLISHQGESMGRKSKIISIIQNEKILVGGNAVKIFEGKIKL